MCSPRQVQKWVLKRNSHSLHEYVFFVMEVVSCCAPHCQLFFDLILREKKAPIAGFEKTLAKYIFIQISLKISAHPTITEEGQIQRNIDVYLASLFCSHGTYQANGPKINGRESPPQAAGHHGRAQVAARHRRSEEAAPVSSGHRGAARDPKVSEVDGPASEAATLSASSARDRSGVQERLAIPELRCSSDPRSRRGVSSGAIRRCAVIDGVCLFYALCRRYQPVCDPRQAGDHHAQGHAAGPAHPRGTCLSVKKMDVFWRQFNGVFQHHHYGWCECPLLFRFSF